jgi:nifR3 family TIM-barrel protein
MGNGRTEALARRLPEERPLAMQLLGNDPDVLAEAARRLEAAGADGIDLNMGCPVAKIVAKGQGAALMRDPLGAAVILRTLRKAVAGPLTIKIRGGWDDRALNAVEVARVAEAEGVDAITVHPRTRSQQFTGRAPWAIIADVATAVRVPVVGNGDVRTVDDARAMVAATGCAAVMVGRGALGRPWVFRGRAVTRDERAAVVRRHCALIEAHLPERLALVQLKKHLAWYSDGLPNAARTRPALFAARTAAEACAIFWALW